MSKATCIPSDNSVLRAFIFISDFGNRSILHETHLAYFFRELRELIVTMDYHDLTTPGLPDEITFINLLPESFSKHCVVTNYSRTILSMCEEFIVGAIYGEWKPDHWYTLVCYLKHSLKSHFMWKQEKVQKISNSTKTISADDLYYALRDDKIRAAMLNSELFSIFLYQKFNLLC